MIDTVILSIPEKSFSHTDDPNTAPWALHSVVGNYRKLVKNQTAKQKEDGVYRPRLRINERITQEIYDKKLKEYKEKQYDINIRMEEYTRADENFHIVANTVLSLANRALDIFESSGVNEKRQLLNFLLQNCRLSGKNLSFELKAPFDAIQKYAHHPTMLASPV